MLVSFAESSVCEFSSPGFEKKLLDRSKRSQVQGAREVVRDRVVIALNRGLSFELQNRHLWLHSYKLAVRMGVG